ncbi:PREDICTED: uncharacterized protein LOC105977545 isoform X2 [Erythranthe guttata]|uniref:uncharacterized protein LOC105977545 isoform X2 n=1 Tax=Erythranthe guttata TaxID=4155 RepID=UPI00064E1079|nr:PREDICTED: uncharacterized protein LOC105977545 isoform X2 [Erythranthe guttata]|eukprot:XP_012858317.1 PREDICTED: uncharacterized protein LOC105977545 isoform X2 [Erythranthe guttata]
MACTEHGGMIKVSMKEPEKISMKKVVKKYKLHVCEEDLGYETTQKKPKRFGPAGFSVWYNGDPTRRNPDRMEIMKQAAELVIDVFNKTHLNKYSFVGMVHATEERFPIVVLDMIFTVQPEPEEDGVDKNHINVRGPVFYDGGPTSFADETMKIVQRCADLAIQVYNKTHAIRYSLIELVRATRHLPPVFMIDLVFTAKPTYDYEQDDDEEYLKTFRARVSVTHNYVEFVEIVRPPRRL